MHNTTSLPPREFTEWAKGFGGMAGGNLNAPLWVCDLEVYVEGKGVRPFVIGDGNAYESDGMLIPCLGKGADNSDWSLCDKRVAKLAASLFRGDINSWQEYANDEMCTDGGSLFKMTLYPLNVPAPDDDWWAEEHFIRTGFSHKTEYKAWCIRHRFPFIRYLVEKHKPRVIVCTSKQAELEYRLAFAPGKELFNTDYFEGFNIEMCHVDRFTCANGTTKVLIAPLFGAKNVLSDEGISRLAEKIGGIHALLPKV